MTNATLQRLSESPLALAPGETDIRNAKVVDHLGEELGRVDALYIDKEAKRVRFVLVAGGGFLGIGDEHRLVPVEAIDRVDAGSVRLRETRARVGGSPRYDPRIIDDPAYLERIYGWYGYSPFWGTGMARGGRVIPLPPARR